MYFRKLQQLQVAENEEQYVSEIDRILAEVSSHNLHRFSPSTIAHRLQVDDKVALELLLKCATVGVVSVNYEVECPECGCSDFRVDNLLYIPDEERTCRACDEKYTPDLELIWITFDLKDKPHPK